MTRGSPSIAVGATVALETPVATATSTRTELAVAAGLVAGWLVVVVTTVWVVDRAVTAYFWRRHDHGDVLLDAVRSDLHGEEGGTQETTRRLSLVTSSAPWVALVVYLVVVYGVVWPGTVSDPAFVALLAVGCSVGTILADVGLDVGSSE